MLRKEKIGDSSGGVSSACAIRGGLREKTIDAGREPIPSPRGVAPPIGDNSGGGDGVSGDGVCHLGGVWAGVTLFDDFRRSFLDSWCFEPPPKVDINERTNGRKGG